LTEEELDLRSDIYRTVFQECPTQDIKQKSRAEREAKEMDEQKSRNLSYTEIGFEALAGVLERIKEKHGPLYVGEGVFLDLGSGAGKACLAAGLLHPFQKVVGIEVMDCLNEAANAGLARLNNPEVVTVPEEVTRPEFQFIKADFVADFEAQLAPLAKEVSVCLAVATCFGPEQIEVMSKLATILPEGAIFITFTHKIAESLIIDINRRPKQRRALAAKRTLGRRGTESRGVEIELDAAVNDPNGWRLLSTEQMEMDWGTPTCFIFKKHAYPYCYPGDLCMIKLPAEAEDPTSYVALYAEPAQVQDEDGTERTILKAVFFDDTFGEAVEVGEVSPFTAEDHQKALAKYRKAAEMAKSAANHGAGEAVAQAVSQVQSELQLEPEAFGIKCEDEQGEFTKEVNLLAKKLLGSLGPLGKEAWAMRFVAGELPQAVHAQIEMTRGAAEQGQEQELLPGMATLEMLTQAWVQVRTKFVQVLQGRCEKVEAYTPP